MAFGESEQFTLAAVLDACHPTRSSQQIQPLAGALACFATLAQGFCLFWPYSFFFPDSLALGF